MQGEQVVDAIATKEGTKRTGVADIEGLRDAIQALCKSTNPLGKTMDYMQEDVDSMNKELASWKTETTKVLELKLEQERYLFFFTQIGQGNS